MLTLLLHLQLLNLASGPSFSNLPLFPGGLPSFSLFLNIILAPPQSCLESRTACLGNASWNAICSEKRKTLHRQHFPLCPPSPASPILARVVSTSSKGNLKVESHVQMETLRNPVPIFPREGGLCWSHLSAHVKPQGLRQGILCLLEH